MEVVNFTLKMPMVTVIIPCFNEEKIISDCLNSILNQTYPQDQVQIIAVDGGSTDGTLEIVRTLARLNPILLLDNPKRTPPHALNLGLKAAVGDIIMRVDGHTTLAPDYLEICVSSLLSGSYDCVGGVVKNCFKTRMGMVNAAILGSKFGVGNSQFRTGKKRALVDTVAFGAYRREVFQRIGCFNEALSRNQDIEFNQRLIRAGGRILMEPEAQAFYHVRETLSGLIKQGFGNGLWNLKSTKIAGNHLRLRHFTPMIFVGTIAVCLALFPVTPIPLAVLGVVYGLFLLAASVDMACRVDLGGILLLPIATALLHLAYGLGSWVAIVESIGQVGLRNMASRRKT